MAISKRDYLDERTPWAKIAWRVGMMGRGEHASKRIYGPLWREGGCCASWLGHKCGGAVWLGQRDLRTGRSAMFDYWKEGGRREEGEGRRRREVCG